MLFTLLPFECLVTEIKYCPGKWIFRHFICFIYNSFFYIILNNIMFIFSGLDLCIFAHVCSIGDY